MKLHNALYESFFAIPECELLDRRRFKTQAEARMVIFEFLEGWYNMHRSTMKTILNHKTCSVWEGR
jgi:hypothetical protein